jgi:hypothetical protein
MTKVLSRGLDLLKNGPHHKQSPVAKMPSETFTISVNDVMIRYFGCYCKCSVDILFSTNFPDILELSVHGDIIERENQQLSGSNQEPYRVRLSLIRGIAEGEKSLQDKPKRVWIYRNRNDPSRVIIELYQGNYLEVTVFDFTVDQFIELIAWIDSHQTTSPPR